MKEIILPWPDRKLHPNARVHWAVRARAAKAARQYAGTLGWAHGLHREHWPDGRIDVHIMGYRPTARKTDRDGLLSALKPSLDGLADAMGVDDSRFVPHPDIADEVRKGGEVRIRITTGAEA